MPEPDLPHAYIVTATLPDSQTADRYLRWLTEGGHLADVLRHGALSAQVIRLDDAGPAPVLETRYLFPNQDRLNTYIREHAPALRAQGLSLFPPSSGVVFHRRSGPVLAQIHTSP
ncbi:DUF4286 family protein [Leptolyngbya sp. 15MV]|nr:DUF4286 family protein [Leptolyngbya sp. 15MV]